MAVSTLRDYLEVLKRRIWVVLLPLVVIPIGAIFLSLRQSELHEASAQVLISRDNLATQLEGLSDATTADPARTAQTQALLARVPEVARRALATARIKRDPSDLLGASSVRPLPDTDILVFTVKDGSPEVAILLANAYAREFTGYRRELESEVLQTARARVRDELKALRDRGDGDTPAYNTLLAREQQLLTMEALQTGRAVVVRAASGAAQTRPQPTRAAMIGLVLALVLALALAFLYEALDSRARSAHDVAARLRLPLLARIPRPPRRIRRSKQLVMLSAPYSKDAEAFRMLRANVEFAALDRGARVLMVTSAHAGEGKSTTVANLAISLSRAGLSTVVVDLDLRNSFLESLFGLEGAPGVTDVVAGHVDLEQALVGNPVPEGDVVPHTFGTAGDHQLWFLPSGSAGSAVDFGSTKRLPGMLKRLSERADVVLVDAPPLLLTGDAMAFTAHVDGVIVVTRAHVVRAAALDELRRILDMVPSEKVGFIMTGSRESGAYYGGEYAAPTPRVVPPTHPARDVDAPWKGEGVAMMPRQRK